MEKFDMAPTKFEDFSWEPGISWMLVRFDIGFAVMS